MSTIQFPVNDRRPKKSFSSISLLGWKALDLVNTYTTEIEVRLPGIGERLGEDLEAMGEAIPGAIQARNVSVALTQAQRALLQKGCERAREVRETVRRGGATKEVQKAYGVGRSLGPNQLGNVKAALQQIVERATKAPDEAAGFGLIAADVSALSSLAGALSKADAAQDQKRASAPLSTKERNRTGNRIVQAVVLVAGAGRSAFTDDPNIRARFNELMEGLKTRGTSKAKAKAKAKKSAAASGADLCAAPTAAPSGTAPSPSKLEEGRVPCVWSGEDSATGA